MEKRKGQSQRTTRCHKYKKRHKKERANSCRRAAQPHNSQAQKRIDGVCANAVYAFYSLSHAPVELLFAYLKRGNLCDGMPDNS